MGIIYFAYGRNMDTDVLAEQFGVTTFQEEERYIGIGRLQGYRFMINEKGVATVVADGLKDVYGVLWNVDPMEAEMLIDSEGDVAGHYRMQMLPVEDMEITCYLALVYVDENTTPGEPEPGYLEAIVEAAERNGLPKGYRDELKALRSLVEV